MLAQPTPAPADTPEANEALDERVRAILAQPEFPAFSQQIVETLQVLEHREVSAHKLAEIVSRNYGLTVKVLRAANSFGTNPLGVSVLDLAHAIFRLGIGRVRSLAGGMVFFEHFHDKSGPLRNLMVQSLITANQAHDTAERIGSGKPEVAYLCAMLRNMGEVLIAAYFPADYDRVVAEVTGGVVAPAEASRNVLGFTFEELGAAMAKQWNLPTEVSASMAPPPPTASSESKLLRTVRLAHGLTMALHGDGPGERATRVALVVDKFAVPLGITKQDAETIAENAIAEARHVFVKLNVPLKELQVLDKKRVSQAFRGTQGATGSLPGSGPARPSTGPDPARFAEIEGEVDRMVRAPAGTSVATVVSLVLKAMREGAGLNRVLFGLVSPSRTSIQGRVAVGPKAEVLRASFNLPVGKGGGPMGLALARQEDLLLRTDAKKLPNEELAQLKQYSAGFLGLLPVTHQGMLLGCLYFDGPNPAHAPTPEMQAGLRRLRDRCAVILSRRQ